ncbi:3-deoxy-manno-octulosonate cytidylyltransferase [Sutcliffiella horikoshii]|uniref:3-deoxy-manno-octulosonate cytidylyltransferase n=1 Tax=Sutcliffiella horikoshii TaxID=79883 RepID=UPI001CFD4203|nr:3-deoxy-manno-octulosonate cytidylyltransferase [Sutcliffiella horikoshii]
MKNVVAIIPARYNSTRLPGKPLVDICGKPMVQRVYEAAKSSQKIARVIIATDDQRIYDEAENFGAEVFLTSEDHQNGTSRAAEVVTQVDTDYVIIVQGDEPMIYRKAIDLLVDSINDQDVAYSLMHPISDGIDASERAKVVTDMNGYALLFSRSRIPYNFSDKNPKYYKGVGVYGFEKEFLLKYLTLPMGPIEKAESIEFLRVLENGYKIKMVEMENSVQCVDTEDDLSKVRNYFKEKEV